MAAHAPPQPLSSLSLLTGLGPQPYGRKASVAVSTGDERSQDKADYKDERKDEDRVGWAWSSSCRFLVRPSDDPGFGANEGDGDSTGDAFDSDSGSDASDSNGVESHGAPQAQAQAQTPARLASAPVLHAHAQTLKPQGGVASSVLSALSAPLSVPSSAPLSAPLLDRNQAFNALRAAHTEYLRALSQLATAAREQATTQERAFPSFLDSGVVDAMHAHTQRARAAFRSARIAWGLAEARSRAAAASAARANKGENKAYEAGCKRGRSSK